MTFSELFNVCKIMSSYLYFFVRVLWSTAPMIDPMILLSIECHLKCNVLLKFSLII